jgi:hypothetical protein
MTTGQDWVARYAETVGVPAPSEEETEVLLALAGVAAHASERTAAPLSTWLAGRAGISPERARQAARDLAAALDREAAPEGSGDHAGPPG